MQPMTARHGYAASSKADVQQAQRTATAAQMPLATTVVLLAAHDPADLLHLESCSDPADIGPAAAPADTSADGLELQSLQQEEQLLAMVWCCTSAWNSVLGVAMAAGITSQQHLGALLLLADTFAAVAAQLTLLPLADVSHAHGGRPHIALLAVESVLSAAAADPAVMNALKTLKPGSPAAAAWQWWQAHGTAAAAAAATAAAAADPAADAGAETYDDDDVGSSHAHLAAPDRQWLCELMAAASSVSVAAGCALPCELQTLPAAASLSSVYRFSSKQHLLLAAVPLSKNGSSILRSEEQLGELDGKLSNAGSSLCCSPMHIRQRLNSRAGCVFLSVAMGPELLAAQEGSWLLPLLQHLGGDGYVVVDATDWRWVFRAGTKCLHVGLLCCGMRTL
jgi:hypothetical protein